MLLEALLRESGQSSTRQYDARMVRSCEILLNTGIRGCLSHEANLDHIHKSPSAPLKIYKPPALMRVHKMTSKATIDPLARACWLMEALTTWQTLVVGSGKLLTTIRTGNTASGNSQLVSTRNSQLQSFRPHISPPVMDQALTSSRCCDYTYELCSLMRIDCQDNLWQVSNAVLCQLLLSSIWFRLAWRRPA